MINKENILFVITIILSIVFITFGYNICKYESDSENQNFEEAKVITIDSVEDDEFSGMKNVTFHAKLLTGESKGDTFEMVQSIQSSFVNLTKIVEENDNIVVLKTKATEYGESSWVFVEYNRIGTIMLLITIFLILILLIGKSKGFKTILSLMFTILAIFYVYIPAILNGYNIYISTIIVTLFIIFMSLTIINGYNKKTLSAILGNIGGVIVAGILGLIINNLLNLTGIVDENYVFLTFLDNGASIDLKAIMWGGMVIGSLGAVMDVAMSISSSMNELSANMKDKSVYNLITSGMNIGKDAIGTMTNTLILAYVGSSLATILLLTANSTDMLYLFNREMIVVEILQAILGSMGILFAVPFTVIFSAKIFYND